MNLKPNAVDLNLTELELLSEKGKTTAKLHLKISLVCPINWHK